MNILKSLTDFIRENLAELYTLLVLTVALPLIVGWMVELKWGLFMSFVIQAVIGIFYIKGKQ